MGSTVALAVGVGVDVATLVVVAGVDEPVIIASRSSSLFGGSMGRPG